MVIQILIAVNLCLSAFPARTETSNLSEVSKAIEKNREVVKKVSQGLSRLKSEQAELTKDLSRYQATLNNLGQNNQSLKTQVLAEENSLDRILTRTSRMEQELIREIARRQMIAPPLQSLASRSLKICRQNLEERQLLLTNRREEYNRFLEGQESLQKMITTKKGNLNSIRSRLKTQETDYKRLQREAAALNKTFKNLKAEAAARQNLTKNLPWPIEGREDKPMGELKGMVIRPTYVGNPEPVKAVADGKVVFADQLPGLKQVVILQHGEYYTVYGNLASISADPGKTIQQGDPVGSLEKDLDARRGGLYFEVRHHDRSLEPKQWLAPGPVSRRSRHEDN